MKLHKGLVESAKLLNGVLLKLLPEFKVFTKECIIEALNKDTKKEVLESYVSKLSEEELNILSESAVDAKFIAESYVQLAKESLKMNLEDYKDLIVRKLSEAKITDPEYIDALIDLALVHEALSFAFDGKFASHVSKLIFEACKNRIKKKTLNESLQVLREMGLLASVQRA